MVSLYGTYLECILIWLNFFSDAMCAGKPKRNLAGDESNITQARSMKQRQTSRPNRLSAPWVCSMRHKQTCRMYLEAVTYQKTDTNLLARIPPFFNRHSMCMYLVTIPACVFCSCMCATVFLLSTGNNLPGIPRISLTSYENTGQGRCLWATEPLC